MAITRTHCAFPPSPNETRICGRDYIPSAFQPQILARSPILSFWLLLFVRPPDTPILTPPPPYGGFLSAPTMTTYLLSKKRGERRRRRWGGKGNGVEWRKGSEMSVRSQMALPEAKKKLGKGGRENQRIGERSETRIPSHSTTSPPPLLLLHA